MGLVYGLCGWVCGGADLTWVGSRGWHFADAEQVVGQRDVLGFAQ